MTYTVPGSIDPTGSSDVSTALQNWLNTVPDDNTIILPDGATYKFLGAGLNLQDRNNLVLTGYGCTFRNLGPGGSDNSAGIITGWTGSGGTNILIEGLTIIGANPSGGTNSAYHPGTESSSGFNLYRNPIGWEIRDCVVTDQYGHGIYIASGGTGLSAQSMNIHNNQFARTGVMGMAIRNGISVTFQNNTVTDAAISPIDIEDTTAGEPIHSIYFIGNTLNRWGWSNAFTPHAIQGDGATGADWNDIRVQNNVLLGGPQNNTLGSTDAWITFWGTDHKVNILVDSNDGSTLPEPGWGMRFNNVTGVTVTNNQFPGASPLAEYNNCTGIDEAGNNGGTPVPPPPITPTPPPPPPPSFPPVPPPPSTSGIVIYYDGTDITADVVIETATFTQMLQGNAGDANIRVRDDNKDKSFSTGKELLLEIDGQLVWGGYVMNVARGNWFDVEDSVTTGIGTVDSFWDITGSDYNILFQKRIVYNKADPTKPLKTYPTGSPDNQIILDIFTNFSDLGTDGVYFSGITNVGSPNPDKPGNMGNPGDTLGTVMDQITRLTGAIYGIGPNKLAYNVDVNADTSPWALTDTPSADTDVGYRELEILYNGTNLINDALIWGAGTGSGTGPGTGPVGGANFVRIHDQTSINQHGRWQYGEFTTALYTTEGITNRARSFVYGSPENHRGGKDDAVSVICTVFTSGFLVGQVASFTNNVFGFSDDIPIRQMDISFINPNQAKYKLYLSHSIDQPWSNFEFYFPPIPPIIIPIPTLPAPGNPYQCISPSMFDDFNRSTDSDFGSTSGDGFPWVLDSTSGLTDFGCNGSSGAFAQNLTGSGGGTVIAHIAPAGQNWTLGSRFLFSIQFLNSGSFGGGFSDATLLQMNLNGTNAFANWYVNIGPTGGFGVQDLFGSPRINKFLDKTDWVADTWYTLEGYADETIGMGVRVYETGGVVPGWLSGTYSSGEQTGMDSSCTFGFEVDAVPDSSLFSWRDLVLCCSPTVEFSVVLDDFDRSIARTTASSPRDIGVSTAGFPWAYSSSTPTTFTYGTDGSVYYIDGPGEAVHMNQTMSGSWVDGPFLAGAWIFQMQFSTTSVGASDQTISFNPISTPCVVNLNTSSGGFTSPAGSFSKTDWVANTVYALDFLYDSGSGTMAARVYEATGGAPDWQVVLPGSIPTITDPTISYDLEISGVPAGEHFYTHILQFVTGGFGTGGSGSVVQGGPLSGYTVFDDFARSADMDFGAASFDGTTWDNSAMGQPVPGNFANTDYGTDGGEAFITADDSNPNAVVSGFTTQTLGLASPSYSPPFPFISGGTSLAVALDVMFGSGGGDDAAGFSVEINAGFYDWSWGVSFDSGNPTSNNVSFIDATGFGVPTQFGLTAAPGEYYRLEGFMDQVSGVGGVRCYPLGSPVAWSLYTVASGFPLQSPSQMSVVLRGSGGSATAGERRDQFFRNLAFADAPPSGPPPSGSGTTINNCGDGVSGSGGGTPVSNPTSGDTCETVWTLTDIVQLSNGYLPNTTKIYVNGLFQRPALDYTESDPGAGRITLGFVPGGSAAIYVCYTIDNTPGGGGVRAQ